jgi:lipoprotein-anchoring transpeptidase ErfK/SrfK
MKEPRGRARLGDFLQPHGSAGRCRWNTGSRPRRFGDCMRRIVLALVAGLVVVVACATFAQEGRYEGTALPASARIDRLVIDKSEHTLEAYEGSTLLKTYSVAIGMGGEGPKQWEGDQRTPEGSYRIDRRHRSREFHRFLHVSYPSAADRRRYRELSARGEVPRGAGIGRDIGIHGEPSDFGGAVAVALDFDWTAGCIAVSNEEIEELYTAVVPNAVVEIRP